MTKQQEPTAAAMRAAKRIRRDELKLQGAFLREVSRGNKTIAQANEDVISEFAAIIDTETGLPDLIAALRELLSALGQRRKNRENRIQLAWESGLETLARYEEPQKTAEQREGK